MTKEEKVQYDKLQKQIAEMQAIIDEQNKALEEHNAVTNKLQFAIFTVGKKQYELRAQALIIGADHTEGDKTLKKGDKLTKKELKDYPKLVESLVESSSLFVQIETE